MVQHCLRAFKLMTLAINLSFVFWWIELLNNCAVSAGALLFMMIILVLITATRWACNDEKSFFHRQLLICDNAMSTWILCMLRWLCINQNNFRIECHTRTPQTIQGIMHSITLIRIEHSDASILVEMEMAWHELWIIECKELSSFCSYLNISTPLNSFVSTPSREQCDSYICNNITVIIIIII